MDPILGMVDHAIKLHVRRRVQKTTNNIGYNNINENNNENNNEGVDEQPKKRKGRPKKVP
jgi:hypothetical protein